jgi:hypothetical protein
MVNGQWSISNRPGRLKFSIHHSMSLSYGKLNFKKTIPVPSPLERGWGEVKKTLN